jgi:hypothetical protein
MQAETAGEACHARVAADPHGADSVRFAHERRFLLSEERTLLPPIEPRQIGAAAASTARGAAARR